MNLLFRRLDQRNLWAKPHLHVGRSRWQKWGRHGPRRTELSASPCGISAGANLIMSPHRRQLGSAGRGGVPQGWDQRTAREVPLKTGRTPGPSKNFWGAVKSLKIGGQAYTQYLPGHESHI
jgi:hypothetical protein